MYTTTIEVVEKYPSEITRYGVDWRAELADVTITMSEWSEASGEITFTDPQVSGVRTSVLHNGGVSGTTYTIVNIITASDGQVLQKRYFMNVI